MLNFVNKLFGSSGKRILKQYEPIVNKINNLENNISKLNDGELSKKTSYFKYKYI